MNDSFSIIAATNFSNTGNNAVTYAAGFAKATGAKLILFNAFSLSIHSLNSRISAAEMQNELDKAATRLKNLADDLSKLFNIQVSSYCSYTFLEEELSKMILNTGAEMVFMGMADRTFEQDLLGNSTTSVIKNVTVSVVAVPEKARFSNLKKILFAYDQQNFSSTKRFIRFAKIAKTLEAEVEFFSVEDSVTKLTEKQKELKLSHIEAFQNVKFLYKNIKSGTIVNEIKLEIIRYNADLLVMAPQKYGFWDSLVHVSKTRMMASGLDIPLLSIPNY